MASVGKYKAKDGRIYTRILFVDAGDGRRRTIRLGRVNKEQIATVKNMVEENLTNIQWTVSPKAPVILYSLGMSGTIPYLAPGQETTFKTGLCAGFGRLTVTVHAGDATAVAHGFLLGPFILGLK